MRFLNRSNVVSDPLFSGAARIGLSPDKHGNRPFEVLELDLSGLATSRVRIGSGQRNKPRAQKVSLVQ